MSDIFSEIVANPIVISTTMDPMQKYLDQFAPRNIKILQISEINIFKTKIIYWVDNEREEVDIDGNNFA